MVLEKIKYIVNIVIVALMLSVVTIRRDGRVMGYDLLEQSDNQTQSVVTSRDEAIEEILADGTRVISSAPLSQDVIGYGGRTPLKIYLKGELIESVEAEPNNETPSFMSRVVASGLMERWNGLSLADAALLEVDNVSGATYTTVAVVENVRRAAQWGAHLDASNKSFLSDIGLKEIAGLIVILLGVVLTFVKSRNRHLVTVQMVLNIGVLGFWCGSFLSLSTLTTWISNGVNLSLSLVSFALLCAAVVVPLFGKKGSYCHLHCPMGSAQELLGRAKLTKVKLSPRVARFLNALRYYILAILLLIMWLGVGFDLINYEIFSAFIFSSASRVVLVLAAIFLTLSLFIHRPYCRFVCPTGALITLSQKSKG